MSVVPRVAIIAPTEPDMADGVILRLRKLFPTKEKENNLHIATSYYTVDVELAKCDGSYRCVEKTDRGGIVIIKSGEFDAETHSKFFKTVPAGGVSILAVTDSSPDTRTREQLWSWAVDYGVELLYPFTLGTANIPKESIGSLLLSQDEEVETTLAIANALVCCEWTVYATPDSIRRGAAFMHDSGVAAIGSCSTIGDETMQPDEFTMTDLDSFDRMMITVSSIAQNCNNLPDDQRREVACKAALEMMRVLRLEDEDDEC